MKTLLLTLGGALAALAVPLYCWLHDAFCEWLLSGVAHF
jgi:hypothetical protein